LKETIVTFQAKAPHKKHRWLALLAIVMLGTGLTATSVLAHTPTGADFTFTADDAGANDYPGQKDLTAQSSLNHDGYFWTAWKWDDIAWNGNNTGDGCSLFDTNDDGFVEYAVCATIKGKNPVTFVSVALYSCNNKWVDRCGGSTLLFTSTSAGYCTITDKVGGEFDTADTLAVCNITLLAAAADPDVTTLTAGTLLNTCSYPSQQPNSDPSDCVLTPTAVSTSVTTLSSGTTTWSATLNDTATLNPTTATGGVVFKLYYNDSTCAAASLIWTSPSVSVTASGTATTAGGGSPTDGNTVSTAGTYYWTTEYTPTGLFLASSSTCGEATVVTAPSVTGSAG
jgi:hypothetical protein